MSFSSFFDGYNAGYAQELYERFSRDPDSVTPQWRAIFSMGLEELDSAGLIVPEALRVDGSPAAVVDGGRFSHPVPAAGADVGSGRHVVEEGHLLPRIAQASALIQAFRDHGHQLARVDPLGTEPPGHPQLDPAFFGTSMEDLEEIPTSLILREGGTQPLADTLRRLREIYCGSIGYQFEHLEDPEKVRWLWSQAESGFHSQPLGEEQKVALLERLSQVEGMERFLHRSYLGQKRFSLEGADMLVPMLDLALEEAARDGAGQVILGMSHRGRLNVLMHVLGVGYRALIREFEEAPREKDGLAAAPPGTEDVKYHLGARGSYRLSDGSMIDVTLVPNPSHLEFVNPVVIGMTRALQSARPVESRGERASVLPILIHGDAAFAAEGVVAESLNLARLEGYSVGGTVHIIVNNQVGFTTDPRDGRSTRYSSDVAKGYDIPVLHVNADDPEACMSAIRLAMAYRAAFRDDVLIDLVGYRRYGHNEGDEPSYTQPLLYDRIAEHPSVRTKWANRIISERLLSEDDVAGLEDRVITELRTAQRAVQDAAGGRRLDALGEPTPEEEPRKVSTGVPLESLSRLNASALAVPDTFCIHPKLLKQFEQRRKDFGASTQLDWGHAEILALASILEEGIPIRLTGQDTERGTFSQRHLVLHDTDTGEELIPLSENSRGRFEVYNSPLSETAALGFEYGYSVVAATDLVLWEAQFGDFVNVAQVIVDQFIASGRSKWGQMSNLTLLLPHGYEGQGPEHSSARLERFLQLCAEDNMRVTYPTTPAQYFHLLRRQALANQGRPLVIMTPKSLLRHPLATSSVGELSDGGFRPVLPERGAPGEAAEVDKLILCAGKIYYDLVSSPDRRKLPNVAVGRLEQLYGFPENDLRSLLEGYPKLTEVVWVQEEPRNMGALGYIGPRLRSVVPREIPLRHVARPARSSPAEGRNTHHRSAQESIVRDALGLA